MERDLLQRVIDTEREIVEAVAAEKKRAAEWLASIQQSGADRITAERQRSEELFHQALAQYIAQQNREVSAYTDRLAEQYERIENLSEQTIRAVVLRHVKKILPGEGRDR
jgi:predicted DNA-binding ribbon-helix-helix protein